MLVIFRNPQMINEIKVKPQNFNFKNSFQLLKLMGYSIILKET